MAFLLSLSTLVALVYFYLRRRLIRDTALSARLARAAGLGLALLCACVPLAVLSWRLKSRSAVPELNALGFGWLGFALYACGALALVDVVCFAAHMLRKLRRAPPPSAAEPSAQERQTRRVFVARAAAGSALVAASGIGLFGMRSALWELSTPEVPVGLKRFPRALDGFTIALLSDVHIGPMLEGRFLRHLAEQTNRMRPDLIAVCGDLVDGRVDQIGSQVAELGRLRARHGVYFVTGNHEYYSGVRPWIAFLERLGVRVLMNERVSIGAAGASFDLAGIPDAHAYRVSAIGADVWAATRGRDSERELVMLAHQPVQVRDTLKVGAGLQLSGHTHGGQLYPFGEIALLAQPYLAGLHRHEASDTQVYVSRGTGFWGPPMRVLAPAEIAILKLYAAS